jgi:hypothetical protein
MALPNTKNNFFARLLGKTTRDKFAQADQDPVLPGQVQNPGLRFSQSPQKQFSPQPDFITGSQPTQPSQPQTQTGQPQQQQPGTVGAQQESRYRLMQMIEPKPERDQEGLDIIQRRAKINAIGKGFSALAGLGGMAMGGDAPVIPDMVTPFNLNQIQVMDADYRNRLQDWVNRSFQVEAANNEILNRETDQTIDAENAMERVKLQGENARQLAEQRAAASLQQLQAKSQAEQIKAMQEIGINPEDPKAYEKYLNAQRQKFNTDIGYTRSRTAANNYRSSSEYSSSRSAGGSGKEPFPYSLETVKKGRDAKISQLEAQRDAEMAKTNYETAKNAIAERFDKIIDNYRKYNPGSNELMDMEMAELGFQMEEQAAGGSPAGGKSTQPRDSFQYDPRRGMTNVPAKTDPIIQSRLQDSFKRASEGNITEQDLMIMIQDLIDSGEAEDEEAAYQYIESYIEKYGTNNN